METTPQTTNVITRNVEAVTAPLDRDLLPTPDVTLRQRDLLADDGPVYENTFQAIPDIVQTDWTLAWANVQAQDFEPDSDFELTENLSLGFISGLPDEYHGLALKAVSEPHLDYLKRVATEDSIREQKLSTLGLGGTALRLAMSVLDPTAVAAVLATEGAAGPYVAALKVGRIGRMLSEGALVGAGTAGEALIASSVNPKIGGPEIGEAFGIGLAFGGAFGLLRKLPETQGEAADIFKLGKKVEKDNAIGSTAGAAQAGNIHPGLSATAPILDEAPKGAFGPARFDAVGQTTNSESGVARFVAPFLGEESVGFKDNSVVAFSASEWGSKQHRKVRTSWEQTLEPSWNKWADDNGVSFFERNNVEHSPKFLQFNKEISEFIEARGVADADLFHPAVRQAGTKFRQIMGDYADLARNPGADVGDEFNSVRGFENITRDDFYTPKYADHDSINALISKFGTQRMETVIKGAVLRRLPQMADEIASRIATGYLKRISNAGFGAADDINGAFRNGNPDLIREVLTDTGDLTAEQIDNVVALVGRDRGKESSRAKQRTLLDYTHGATFRVNGVDEKLTMQDFFVKDADQILNRYSREMSGRIGLAKVRVRDPNTDDLIIDGITSRTDLERLKEWVRDDYKRLGKVGDKGMKRDLDNIEYLYRSIVGQPDYDNNAQWVKWARRFRDFNFIRLMNRMGLNQAQEASKIVGSLGIKAAFKQMPAMKRIQNANGDRVLLDNLGMEMEAMSGLGTDAVFQSLRYRNPDSFMAGENLVNKPGHNIDSALQLGKKVTSNISGMTHVNTFLQQWVTRAAAQRFSDMAHGRGLAGLKGKDPERLKALGLSEEASNALFDQMRQHSRRSGTKLDALNMRDWDPKVRADFENAIYRWSRKIIQENDAGNLHRFMSEPVAQLVFQFRSFIFGAWAKSTLFSLNHLDMRTTTTALAEITAGAAGHMINTQANAVGRADAAEYLEKRMSMDAIIRAGVARTGVMSLLPMIADTALPAVGFDRQFDFRTSGTASDAFFGVPAIGGIDDLLGFTGGVGDSILDGRKMSQSEILKGARAMPFGNWWPYVSSLGLLISDREYFPPRE